MPLPPHEYVVAGIHVIDYPQMLINEAVKMAFALFAGHTIMCGLVIAEREHEQAMNRWSDDGGR